MPAEDRADFSSRPRPDGDRPRPHHPRRLRPARPHHLLHRRPQGGARLDGREGAKAPQAAGVIHTDFERGFIRAETIAYDDFVAPRRRGRRQGRRQDARRGQGLCRAGRRSQCVADRAAGVEKSRQCGHQEEQCAASALLGLERSPVRPDVRSRDLHGDDARPGARRAGHAGHRGCPQPDHRATSSQTSGGERARAVAPRLVRIGHRPAASARGLRGFGQPPQSPATSGAPDLRRLPDAASQPRSARCTKSWMVMASCSSNSCPARSS